MINLFQPVILVSLVFLGVIVPKLLIGISTAVNTIQKSIDDIKHKQTENDGKIGREIAGLEKQKQEYIQNNLIRKCRKINKRIRNLQKSREKFERHSAKLIKRYELLNYKDGILFPALFILFSLMFSFLGGKCVAPVAIFTSYSFVFIFLLAAFLRVLSCFNIISDAKAREKAYERDRITDAFHKAFNKNGEISTS